MNVLHEAIIGIGSNVPIGADKKIESMCDRLAALGTIERMSGIYVTSPFGNKKPNACKYNNEVIVLSTAFDLEELNDIIKTIETELGRRRDSGSDEVTIDADIVIWDNKIIREVDVKRDYFSIGYKIVKSDVKNIP